MTPANEPDREEYDDTLAQPTTLTNLWRTVLMSAIEDAIHGPLFGNYKVKLREIHAAREYIIKPNKDFDEVCTLADLDPVAVRERVIRLIEKAPPPEFLATPYKRARRQAPGVVSDFAPSKETGAWSVLQEAPDLTFSDKANPA